MGGDGTAFGDFVADAGGRLARTAALLTADPHLAEDLLQTALAKTYVRWRRLGAPDAAEAYVRRVMVHTVIRWQRRRWRGELPAAELPEPVRGDDAYGAADDRAVLRHALAQLPPAQRAVLVLRFFDDKSAAAGGVTRRDSQASDLRVCPRSTATDRD